MKLGTCHRVHGCILYSPYGSLLALAVYSSLGHVCPITVFAIPIAMNLTHLVSSLCASCNNDARHDPYPVAPGFYILLDATMCLSTFASVICLALRRHLLPEVYFACATMANGISIVAALAIIIKPALIVDTKRSGVGAPIVTELLLLGEANCLTEEQLVN